MHNWEELHTFVAVVRTGSIAAAARELKVNHSTVLRRLDSLERTLGVRLFERLQTGYAPTAAGENLRERLLSVEEQIDAAARTLAGLDEALSGPIRLTTTDTLCPLLVPVLQRFREQHPHVALQLVVNTSFLNLTRREADVALRPSNTPPDSLVGRELGSVATALYASRDYLDRAQREGIGCGDWARHQWVGLDDSLAHLAIAQWMAEHVPPARIALQADSLVTMADAVTAGFGVAPLLCLLAEERTGLVRLADPDRRFDTRLWLLCHRDLRNTARVRALMRFIHAELAACRHIAPA
ncbi:LysR family transcriptional regulator [Pseudoduganella sp. SL102]|uniref:LysR family transcriptional regulator n=1 Tax=Pseudoduganella sp. SL102 TaxID=2995154 RepID=UPI00248B5B8C|nr:LysR family transcriptional regulator [Pseudoduganella sp. SL102]WBS02647.1 LysR family transcriptional regulator [Pseudoduganella sp. SL102]